MRADAELAEAADVCLVLEGTYPYVAGGVSSWVHELVRSLPALSFALVHLGPRRGAYGEPRYALPANVTGLRAYYCHDDVDAAGARRGLVRVARPRGGAAPRSRVLRAIARLHLEDTVDDDLLDDLAAADLSVDALLRGDEAFAVIAEIARARAPDASFVDLFWHFRSMHVPLLRLLAAPMPGAAVYHSVSTGYAGAVAAVASRRTGRPLLLTEHGIYARERELELARARWVGEGAADPRLPRLTPSPLRRLWSRYFMRLAQLAYRQAARIVTLSEVNRRKQLADGAPRDKIEIVANGVDVDALAELRASRPPRAAPAPLRVGFVGRVVPIKDVLTFIHACDRALAEVPLAIEVIGPADEDPGYAARCRELVAELGRERDIRFVGPRPAADIFGDLDVCVLTSFSEGQPLVILEAHAAGIPVIATDVGACRELLEGRSDPEDRALGPSGIVTRVRAPDETAAALVRLARDPALRARLGEAGRARVRRAYAKRAMIRAYRTLYGALGEVR